jgi:hypothetical protein
VTIPAASASVALVIPHHSDRLTADEALSLRHLQTYLGEYETYAVVPEGSALRLRGAAVRTLPRRFFRDHRAHQQLMLSPLLYELFASYEFVLVYHLDSLVLARELAFWCARGWDYVGAPWLRRDGAGELVLDGVGNGGFSLRRVESCLRVLGTLRRPLPRLRVGASFAVRVGKRLAKPGAPIRQLLRDRYLFEDKFWGLEAPRLDPSFRVAPAEEALAFAFETHPRVCFELNKSRLPFGCHKWTAHEPDFWQPYLLT